LFKSFEKKDFIHSNMFIKLIENKRNYDFINFFHSINSIIINIKERRNINEI